MSENNCFLEIKDFIDSLKDENNRLLDQLCFAQKCMKLFAKYRNCFNSFVDNCKCDQNDGNKSSHLQLEKEYKLLAEEDMKMCGISKQTNRTVSIGFNKDIDCVFEADENNDIEMMSSDQMTDGRDNDSNSENILLNKMSEHLKDLNDDNDYRLMFLKNTSNDNSDKSSEQFKCNWFKCGLSFGSELSLRQHMKAIHFRIKDFYDNLPLILKTDDEIVIEYKPEIQMKSEYKNIPKRVVNEYVCDWVGCEMGFRTEADLKRHHNVFHSIREKQPSVPKTPKFLGLKPLTIHSLDTCVDSLDKSIEKAFQCDSCDKSYTRKDSLKYHMSTDHNSGDYPIKTHFCTHCEYETKNSGHLKRHVMRKHTNERPFKCDLDNCDPNYRCFATFEQLKAHQLSVHSEHPF